MRQVEKSLHLIRDEVARWRKILDEPYREYLVSKYEVGVTLLYIVVYNNTFTGALHSS